MKLRRKANLNFSSVCGFLRQHRDLIPVLIEAKQKMDVYFGSGYVRSRLEVFVDPEDSDSVPKLVAFVLTPLPFSEASPRLERLQEEWWFDQSDAAISLLNIGVEYVNASTRV